MLRQRQRGVPLYVPTNFVSQVDSFCRRKNRVNHPTWVKYDGAFYQAQAVIIDTETLN